MTKAIFITLSMFAKMMRKTLRKQFLQMFHCLSFTKCDFYSHKVLVLHLSFDWEGFFIIVLYPIEYMHVECVYTQYGPCVSPPKAVTIVAYIYTGLQGSEPS